MGCQEELHCLAQGLQSLPHLQHLLRQLHHLHGGKREGQSGVRAYTTAVSLPSLHVPLTHSLPKLVQHVCVTRLTGSEGEGKQAVLCGP